MKITMFEIEANAEDLRASRSIAETMAMGIGRIADRIADAIGGYGETVEEVERRRKKGATHEGKVYINSWHDGGSDHSCFDGTDRMLSK